MNESAPTEKPIQNTDTALENHRYYGDYCDILIIPIESLEQAKEVVKLVMSKIYIAEDGVRLDVVREGLDFLIAEEVKLRKSTVKEREDSDTIAEVFSAAIEQLEGVIEVKNPKETVEMIVESKLKEAQEKIDSGEFIHAIPLLYTALNNAGFKKFWSKNLERKAEVESLLELTKKKWSEGGKRF